ncbi:hypothetical protein KAH37_03055 [bacterium]|nr:hypothetical protein [bacterium]
MRILVFLLSVLFLASCGTAPKKESSSSSSSFRKKKGEPEIQQIKTISTKGSEIDLSSRDYVVKKFDINKDKVPDMLSIYKKVKNKETGKKELLLYVKEMDLNHDGKIDVYRFFNKKGMIDKEELDLDFDGKIDAVDHYRGGIVRKRELAMRFSEQPTIVKYYDEKRKLIRLEEDQSQNGKIDYWEFYDSGILNRIEKDTDGDGKSDIFKRSGDKEFTQVRSADEEFKYNKASSTSD